MYMIILVCGFEVLCLCMNVREIESFLLLFPCHIIFFTNCTRVDMFTVHFMSFTSSDCQHSVGILWYKWYSYTDLRSSDGSVITGNIDVVFGLCPPFHIQKRIQFSKQDLFPSSSGMVSKYLVWPAAEKSFVCRSQLIRYPPPYISEGGSGFSFEKYYALFQYITMEKIQILSKPEHYYSLKNKRPTWCHLLFYFTSYVLIMFWTLIYPSSGACDCAVELPHRSFCSRLVVCWRFGLSGFEWCPCCRLKLQPATRTPLKPRHTKSPTHNEPRTKRLMW